jgi:valyl-tRNA synthetase
MNMDKHYDFTTLEDKWYGYWIENKLFKSEPNEKTPYVICQPPPNATACLHLGHALNNTIQDVLIRYHKLRGYNTLYLPGIDHGGIATQNVVEKELLKENISRHKLDKDTFIKIIDEFTHAKKDIITEQLKKLGCACDWDRQQYTMNDNFSQLVLKSFVKFYNDGLIYKGKYIVNWCARCTTAISDDEVTYRENNGKMYYLKYKFVGDSDDDDDNDNNYIVVATTRPETIFGDIAIAYNPSDERYNMLENKEVYVPIINRKIKLIKDNEISKTLGTGLVKITPAHDKFDYMIGKKYDLETIEILDEKCKIYNTNTKYDGMDRFKCRNEIIKELTELKLIEKIEPYKNNIGECYRCQTIIEPHLSDQWFLKMDKLIEISRAAINNGDVELIPEYNEKLFNEWTNKKIDWCISRNISWGHQLPIWYCNTCDNIICQETEPHYCENCKGIELKREEFVLDTWFSSGLWAFGVFDNVPDYEYYYPTTTLITGKDILYFWVTKMIMFSLYFTGKVPFKQVLLHGVIRDPNGEKMAKSKGNVIDPLQIIKSYGADALRYTIMYNLPLGDDMNISTTSFVIGKTFCTKLWNASRYILMNIQDDEIELIKINKDDLGMIEINEFDGWIMYKLQVLNSKIIQEMKNYNFAIVLKSLGDFFWNDFCNTYLEIAKTYINNIDTKKRLILLLALILKMYHPFVPFITEELWSYIKQFLVGEPDSIMETTLLEDIIDVPQSLDESQYFIDTIHKIRSLKGQYKYTKMIITCDSFFEFMDGHKTALGKLTKIYDVDVNSGVFNITFVS